MSSIVFGIARPTVQLNVVDNLHNIERKDFSTPWIKLGRACGSTAQPSLRMFLKSFTPSRREMFSTLWNELDRVWGGTTSRWFDRCWQPALYHDKKIVQRCQMNWAVTGDVGERGPAINWKVFNRLHNIQTKRIFNTVKGTGMCLWEHGLAINSIVFEKLHTSQTKKWLNTVKWAGPCLREQN